MTSVAAGEFPDSTVPITGEPKYTDSAEVYLQPMRMEQVDPDNHFHRDATVGFVQDLIKKHAEEAPKHGVDFLVKSATKHWNMSPNDPRVPTHPSPLRSQPTHLSTLCSRLIPCACFFAHVNCSLKPKLHGFFEARYKTQRTLFETPAGPVFKTTTPLFRKNGNTFAEFPQYINYEGTRIASLQRPFNSRTRTIAACDSFHHKPCILSILRRCKPGVQSSFRYQHGGDADQHLACHRGRHHR